jgi:hypothetical protein
MPPSGVRRLALGDWHSAFGRLTRNAPNAERRVAAGRPLPSTLAQAAARVNFALVPTFLDGQRVGQRWRDAGQLTQAVTTAVHTGVRLFG